MKTAQELFKKYEMLAPESPESDHFTVETDCMFYDDFLKAIVEHDKEIESIIDEMIEKARNSLNNPEYYGRILEHRKQDVAYYVSILTDLKEKIR